MSEQAQTAKAPHPHVLPLALYWGVFLALLVLTFTTVAVIWVDLGPFNIVVAMAVAVAKATLVGAVFMHLWWDEKVNLLIVTLTMVFFSIFVMFSVVDVASQNFVNKEEALFKVRDEYMQKYREEHPDGPEPRAFKNEWWGPPKGELHEVQPH